MWEEDEDRAKLLRIVRDLTEERDALAAQCEALANEVADLMARLVDKDAAVASLRKLLDRADEERDRLLAQLVCTHNWPGW